VTSSLLMMQPLFFRLFEDLVHSRTIHGDMLIMYSGLLRL
jgi:hypothetical protein